MWEVLGSNLGWEAMLIIFMVFTYSPSREMLGQHFNIGHNNFLPSNPFKVAVCSQSSIHTQKHCS
jgi:hypothetical protein